jgi:hypothetical protein
MTIGIVERLEMIDIHEQNPERHVIAPFLLASALEFTFKIVSVGHLRKVVEMYQLFKFLHPQFISFNIAQIGKQLDPAKNPSIFIS